MTSFTIFQGVARLFETSRQRRDAAHEDFLDFYRRIVEETSDSIAKAVGFIPVKVRIGVEEQPKEYGILLQASDWAWWSRKLREGNLSFVLPVSQVKLVIVEKLVKAAEANGLTQDERKAMLALLDDKGNAP